MNTLKYFREQKGYTQKELALLCDVNLRSLQDYEQGHKRIADAKASTLYRLAKGLNCSMEDLIINDGNIIEIQHTDMSSNVNYMSSYIKKLKQ